MAERGGAPVSTQHALRGAGSTALPAAISPLRIAAAPMIAVSVALLLVAGRYGPHWDELYFRMLPLRWWYVDQPPLTVWLTWLAAHVSDAVWVQRLPAVAAAAAGALVASLFPRALGTGPWTQRLAAWAHAFTVYPLLMGHIFTTGALDLLAWELVILFVLRAAQGRPRFLVWAGAVAGVACWNKLLVVALLGALFVSLCLTCRWLLRTRETVLGAGLFLVLAAPQLWAQLSHGLPMSQVSAGLVAQQGDVVRLALLPALALFVGPPLTLVALHGLLDPWRGAEPAARFLLPTVLLVVAFTLVSPSQPHYPMGAVLPALSLGWAGPRLRRRWSRGRRGAVVLANAAVACLICLPLLPAAQPWVGVQSAVNPTVRDQLGWPELAAEVTGAREPGEDVVVDGYALAGAVHRYGSPADRAALHSGHNGLWDLGPPRSQRVLLVGEHATALRGSFASCAPGPSPRTGPVVHPELVDMPVLHCEGPTADWGTLWPRFRRISG
ncbi:ArnT family glycosyltransferase [Kocuria tytonis]|uniref:Glycosyltransferase RgtA/B/C/D-like domain-containing protein n=1 Tax=Kocuria tytonis TaxID=2054280 RepID=A0A495A114_9MICC|nr:glycosyltransferase family 39 protein [Kocuria tytonis]RKQ33143.1 hypothetical protein C1C97_012065 [Kocuria tytonis]